MRWYEIIEETTTAGCVAVVAGNGGASGEGAIGAGFDPNGDWGIYNAAKPKKKKAKESDSNVLRR